MSENIELTDHDTNASIIMNNVEDSDINVTGASLDRILVVQTVAADNDEETSEEIEIELPLEFEKLISVDTSQITKLCRTCLNEKPEMHSLYDTWDVETLAEMLATFASVQLILGDGLPESLCHDCVELVGKCYSFKQSCERSESMLRLLMNQGHLQAQVLKDNDLSESKTEPEHRTVIIRNNDENQEYITPDTNKNDFQNENTNKPHFEEDVDDDAINMTAPSVDETIEKLHAKTISNNTKLSALSVVSNPPISIEPHSPEDIKQERIKNTKSEDASKKDKKCKLESLVTNDCGNVDKFEHLTIKLEDSDYENDTVSADGDKYNEENGFHCTHCGKEYSSQTKLSRHEKTHLSIKPFICKVCSKGFNESSDLRRHEKTHKRKEEENEKQLAEDEKKDLGVRYPCSQCNMSFSSEGDLDIHCAVHVESSGKKICHHCKKQFDTILQLKRHVRTHLSDKPYKCRICQKGFPEMGSLTRHFRSHTGEAREKKHLCKHCDKAYHDRHSLNIHMRKHTGERPWICSECGKGFIDSRLLNSHMKIHSDSKPFRCKVCDKRFKHESTLTTHIRIHTGEKPYVCSVCGNAFVQSSNLALHMRTHTQERPYSCDYCPKKFSSSSALTTHRRIHTGEKPYSCNICQKKFARHDLSAHMRRHTGEKPHKCSVCPKKFATVGQMNQHTRIHTGEKPFVCPICRKGCATSSYLKKHMLRAHNTTGIWQIPKEEVKEESSENTFEEKFKRVAILRRKVAIPKNNVKSNKAILARKTEIIPVSHKIEKQSQAPSAFSSTYPSGMVNVVALTASGEVSILSQKSGLNISTLRAQPTDSISTVVSNSGEKLFQIDPSFLRIHHISSEHITIAEIAPESQPQ